MKYQESVFFVLLILSGGRYSYDEKQKREFQSNIARLTMLKAFSGFGT